MARIRFIKPEFFLHERLSELSPLHRLLFIGLWTLADKDGRLEDRPKRIKVEVLPYDDCDLDSMLNDLDSGDFVHRYEVNGERYIAIPGWSKHQKPHPKEQSRNIPEPPCREKTRQAVKFNGKDMFSREMDMASKVDSGVLSLESGVLSLDSGLKPLSASADRVVERPGLFPQEPTDDAASGEARAVFDHWCAVMQKGGKTSFDAKRRSKVQARLKDGYTAEQLKRAIDGCALTPHNMGANDRGEKYNDLELICRDAAHVDRFIANADNPPKPTTKPMGFAHIDDKAREAFRTQVGIIHDF